MKKIGLFFVAILFAVFAVNAQTTTTQNKKGPEMTFDKLTHDYGKIQQNADGNCEFKFKNTGKEPLIITDAHGSCGCTVPSYSKEPVLPGKTGTIKVTYATNRIGVINKNVTVTSNAKNSPIVLNIAGEVLQPATINTPDKPNPMTNTPNK
ncbi:MAG: DUF1573 domain-containing protein [Bacteroidetes bacterium]|nr:DUF1573 domain-containing protein [Bacteroidota bacterium]